MTKIRYLLFLFLFSCCELPMVEKVKLLVKDEQVNDWFSVETDGISMYASAEDKKNNRPECKLYKDEFQLFEQLSYNVSRDSLLSIYKNKGTKRFDDSLKRKIINPIPKIQFDKNAKLPLQNLRIALVHGHYANDFDQAQFEHRFIKIGANPNDTISFYESSLTYASTHFLEEMLVKSGATVLNVPNGFGSTAFDKNFETWLREDFSNTVEKDVQNKNLTTEKAAFLLQKATKEQIFHQYFKSIEMEHCADVVNNFHPNLTVIVHYNVDDEHGEKPTKGSNTGLSKLNYNMAFVAGAFMKNEMTNIKYRLDFLRLLVSNDMANSVLFSQKIMEEFTSVLKVEANTDSTFSYLKKGCISTVYNGIYARNLALTRMIYGTICYGETLCQNNEQESRNLMRQDIEIEGFKAPKRSQMVALAYYKGIMKYLFNTH